MEPRDALPLLGFRRRRTKHVCPASAAIQKVCRIRASKRWSALLTQTKSRIGFKCGMRERLGEVHWAAFVKYAEAEHKASFVRALTPAAGMLCCEGKLDGTACPKAVVIDLKRACEPPRRGSAREGQRATDLCHERAGLRTEDIQWPRA